MSGCASAPPDLTEREASGRMPEEVAITTLANGLRIVSHPMPQLETVSLGIWVGSGARSEDAAENGLSHFLEHMAFKGTETRSARQIVEEIERAGGDLNAVTSLETTAYYVRVLKEDLALAIEILADILLNATFAPEELERERAVILQEIAAAADVPDDVVFDKAQATAFPDQPVGRPILGSAETVRRLTREHLIDHRRRHYRAGNMVLAAAGALDHGALVRHAEAQFAALNRGSGPPVAPARYRGGARFVSGPFEQAHLILGFEGPSYNDDDFYGAQVLSGLFGGGMSSRLFQEAREKRGLCYSIYSFSWGFADSGFFGAHAATSPEQVAELAAVVVDQLAALAEHGPEEAELARAKAQIRVGLAMSLESSGARAEQMARQLLAKGRVPPKDELMDKVVGVDRETVRRLAEDFMQRRKPTWTELMPQAVRKEAGGASAALAYLKRCFPALVN